MTIDRALEKVFGKTLATLQPEELGRLKMEVDYIMQGTGRTPIEAAKTIYNMTGRDGLRSYINTLMGKSEAIW